MVESHGKRNLLALHAGIFLVSAGTLLLEITLVRLFSYKIWYHFAFITIAVALLGFGASGSFAALWRTLGSSPRSIACAVSSALAALSTLLLLYVIANVDFDPMKFMENRDEYARLALYVLATTLPFFFAGLTIALLLSRNASASASLYGADLVGAGLGCMLLAPLLPRIEAAGLLTVCCLLFAAAALALAPRRIKAASALLPLAVLLGVAKPWTTEFIPCKSKPYHVFVAPNQHERDVLYDRWTAIFRTEVYKSQPLLARGASYGTVGCSTQYTGALPVPTGIGHDASACAAMFSFDNESDIEPFFRDHLLTLGYRLRPGGDYCIGGVGGGVDIMAALSKNPASVDGIELDPTTAELITGQFNDVTHGILRDPRVRITVGDARSVIRRSEKLYDVINFTGVDTITAVAVGAQILAESYLYTVDAVEDYLDHLKPNGILCLSAGDTTGDAGQPRMHPRFAAVVAEALRRRGVDNPNAQVVIVAARYGTPAHASLIVKKDGPFTDAELDHIDEFVEKNGHVYWHTPRKTIKTTASSILALNSVDRDTFYANHFLNLTPVTDDRPFFFNFYRWENIFLLLLQDYPEDDSGYFGPVGNIMLLGSVICSAAAAFVIIVVPALIAVRRETRNRSQRISIFDILYFCGIGLGFMLLEIPLIQRLVLFLGYPTYSLTVTLFSMLLFAGLGSYLSRNVSVTSSRSVWLYFSALLMLCLFHLFLGDAILEALLFLPLTARVLIAVTAIAPLGLLLGGFFPIGMRDFGNRFPDAAPLAWAANGACSVIGTFLAVLIANAIGFNATFGVALILYFLTALSFQFTRKAARLHAGKNAGPA